MRKKLLAVIFIISIVLTGCTNETYESLQNAIDSIDEGTVMYSLEQSDFCYVCTYEEGSTKAWIINKEGDSWLAPSQFNSNFKSYIKDDYRLSLYKYKGSTILLISTFALPEQITETDIYNMDGNKLDMFSAPAHDQYGNLLEQGYFHANWVDITDVFNEDTYYIIINGEEVKFKDFKKML